ncbi:hypothetical protein LEN26_012635 [Aphanomyces euteiches]|nr:hypothetical protein AeMF1_021184 [Aphanomyces euteiches]KAH9117514.1 hypothetical protein LEN26_012635 [Aphanomyces euteiches]KAH9188213.1 hypothetical protein AeNC1_009812 [Aphanomyces euteiches]
MSSIPSTMKAVQFNSNVPTSDETSFVDIVVPVPTASGRDILVQVKAVSVNPLDVLLRKTPPLYESLATESKHRILGYDAAGVVVAVGPEASLFKVGDEVYYAGTWVRDGTNAEYHVVDERIAGLKPKSLSFQDAAGLPLTALTAYESIVYRLQVRQKSAEKSNKSILILNGAVGVGSFAIQLLKALTDMTVIASASRPQSSEWVKELGADHVVNHTQDIPSQLAALGIPDVNYVLANTELGPYFDESNQARRQDLLDRSSTGKPAIPKTLLQKRHVLVGSYVFANSRDDGRSFGVSPYPRPCA